MESLTNCGCSSFWTKFGRKLCISDNRPKHNPSLLLAGQHFLSLFVLSLFLSSFTPEQCAGCTDRQFDGVDISSSALVHSSVFFYQLWNLNHSSFGVRPVPFVCPCSEGCVVSKEPLCVSVYTCMCVGGYKSFPVELHTKHFWLLDSRLVSQVHTAGRHIRSGVFVWAEQCPTLAKTHMHGLLWANASL